MGRAEPQVELLHGGGNGIGDGLQAFDKGFEYGSELVHRMAENGDAEPLLLETES